MSNITLPQGQLPVSGKPQRTTPIIWGAILLIVGALMLLQNLGLLEGIAAFVWALLFAAGGLVFAYLFFADYRQRWWAALPACGLLGIAGTIMLGEYAPDRMEFLTGAAFLASVGIGFLAVYLARRDFWWAIIPGGTLVSLSVVAGISDSGFAESFDVGSVLFFGLGITFLLVALTATEEGGPRRWAYIPAGVLLLIGVVIFSQQTAMLAALNYVWPIVLILLGAFFLLQAYQAGRNE